MTRIGFKATTVAAQTFYHEEWQVLAVAHGDDFAAAGEVQQLDKLDEALEQLFVLKRLRRVGYRELSGTTESRFAKRLIAFDGKGFA